MRFTLTFVIAALSAAANVRGGGEQAGVPAGGDDRAAEHEKSVAFRRAHDSAYLPKRAAGSGQGGRGRRRAARVVTEYVTVYATGAGDAGGYHQQTGGSREHHRNRAHRGRQGTSGKGERKHSTTSQDDEATAAADAAFLAPGQRKSNSKLKSATTTVPPSSQPTTPAASSSGSSSLQSDSLAAHNTLRAQHGAAALTWDASLQAVAQAWADKCVFTHGGGAAVGAGENLAAMSGTSGTVAEQIQMWADEASDYNPSNPQYSHFTQMVWKGTKKLGCAMTTCNNLGNTGWSGKSEFFVCEYSPPGNVIGQFAQNVQA